MSVRLSSEDIGIIDELISGIGKREERIGKKSLMRFSLEGPTRLTPDYRIGELKKLRAGLHSDWGEKELAAEKAYRERKRREHHG